MTTIQVSPGIAPLQAQPAWVSTRYYWSPNVAAVGTSATLGNGNLRGVAVYIPNVVTLSRIGAEVTSAGDAGCTYRLGLYTDDGTGRPGSRVIDAGTIAGDSVAVQEIVISQAVSPGVYWVVGAVQGVTVTQPTLRVPTAGGVLLSDAGVVTPGAGSFNGGVLVAGVTGALPAAFGVATLSGNMPRIFVKVA